MVEYDLLQQETMFSVKRNVSLYKRAIIGNKSILDSGGAAVESSICGKHRKDGDIEGDK